MKVKITHTMDLGEVPKRVKELVEPTKQMLSEALAHLEALDFLLSDDLEDNISIAVLHMDVARKRLANVDNVIRESAGMLQGVDEYYTQQSAKESLEQEIIEREQQATEQKESEDDKPF